MTDCIRHMAKEELGESKGMVPPGNDTSWWNEEVKITIMKKRMCYRNLGNNRDEMSFENYKLTKRWAKKTMKEAEPKCIKIYMSDWIPKREKKISIGLLE